MLAVIGYSVSKPLGCAYISAHPSEKNQIALFDHTCAYAWWAHMHRFLSVCLSQTYPKFRRENYSLACCHSMLAVT